MCRFSIEHGNCIFCLIKRERLLPRRQNKKKMILKTFPKRNILKKKHLMKKENLKRFQYI